MTGRAPQRVTQDDYDRVRELHAQGLSRNEIMRQTGRSGKIVSRLAAEQGLSFVRSGSIVAATEAKKIDAASIRADLQLSALQAATALLGQMFEKAKIYNFGGKENTYAEREHDEPPFRDKRDIATAVQALAATALRLAEADKASGSGDERSMLVDLREALRGARDQARGEQP